MALRKSGRRGAALVATLVAPCCTGNPIPSGDAGGRPCQPACGSGRTCDGRTGICVQALGEGEACAAADGLCAPPLGCGPVTATEVRCARECTAKDERQACGELPRECMARPAGSGGFCLTPVRAAGSDCDLAQLRLCVGTDLVCIARGLGDPAGRCFARCDPTQGPTCGDGGACADPWAPADPTRGICAEKSDGGCDYTDFRYCARGETCARGAGAPTGYCHLRCSPMVDPACAAEQQCVTPWPETPASGICVVPQPTGAACDPALDRHCGRSDLCVYVQATAASECARECTGNAGICDPLGKRCELLGDGWRSVCL